MNLLQRALVFTGGHISRYQAVIAVNSVGKNARFYSTTDDNMAAPEESVVAKDEVNFLGISSVNLNISVRN